MISPATGFFCVLFSTEIPASSYFMAASNGGLEARRSDLARKFANNRGWEAWRLDLAGPFSPPGDREPGPTRVMGPPNASYMSVFFT